MQLDKKLTLESTTKLARENEAVKMQQTEMRDQTKKIDIDTVKTGQKSKLKRRPPNSPHQKKGAGFSQKSALPKTHSDFSRCGNSHISGRDNCPARDVKCHKCELDITKGSAKTVDNVQRDDQENFLGAITSGKSEPWCTTLYMNKRPVKFIIDTGADVTVVPEVVYSRKRDGPLRQSHNPLLGPGQYTLEVSGCFEATIKVQGISTKDMVYVVKSLSTPCVGRITIQEVTRDKNSIVTRYPELFRGLGRIEGLYLNKLQDTAMPHAVNTPRRVPIPLLPEVKCELKRMERLGVISKVDGPTDWCSGMVVVPKPGDGVRICVDLTKLNRFLKKERHLLPSVEHVLAQIGDAKIFSKLDANSGFWQIELSPELSKHTTSITPFGRYMFRRLPFGISSAPEFFQKMGEILCDCKGIVGLIDDVLVHGKTEKEHESRLTAVLEKLNEKGVTLNKDK
uniref:Reverse transcriptase domain-containing protein n=2 Tax=Amphimedon queenslandica TaxID=400682 RepID=A0A1X7SIK7_AMPQE